MVGPKGYATTPCGHHFCMQCFVTNDTMNSRDDAFPCPICRRSLGSTIREAQAVRSMPARVEWDREQERLDMQHALAVSMEEAESPPPSSFMAPASSLLPSLEALPPFSAPSPGVSLEPSRAPGVSVPPLVLPQPQPALSSSGTGAALDLSGALRAAMGTASASSQPWRRRSERPSYGPQPGVHFWRTNAAARSSNDGSRSSSVAHSRSGRHRSRSTSPPSRPPPAPSSALPGPGPGLSLRSREIPRSAWGAGIRRQVAWGSALPHHSPSTPPPYEGGRGRW